MRAIITKAVTIVTSPRLIAWAGLLTWSVAVWLHVDLA